MNEWHFSKNNIQYFWRSIQDLCSFAIVHQGVTLRVYWGAFWMEEYREPRNRRNMGHNKTFFGLDSILGHMESTLGQILQQSTFKRYERSMPEILSSTTPVFCPVRTPSSGIGVHTAKGQHCQSPTSVPALRAFYAIFISHRNMAWKQNDENLHRQVIYLSTKKISTTWRQAWKCQDRARPNIVVINHAGSQELRNVAIFYSRNKVVLVCVCLLYTGCLWITAICRGWSRAPPCQIEVSCGVAELFVNKT